MASRWLARGVCGAWGAQFTRTLCLQDPFAFPSPPPPAASHWSPTKHILLVQLLVLVRVHVHVWLQRGDWSDGYTHVTNYSVNCDHKE